MDETNLIKYIFRVKELEAAVFTHKSLIQQYAQLVKTQTPPAPRIRNVPKPSAPDPSLYHVHKQFSLVWVSIAVMLLGCLFGIQMILTGRFWGLIGIVAGLLAIVLIKDEVAASRALSRRNQELAEEYVLAEKNYLQQTQQYSTQLEQAKQEYAQALSLHAKKLEKYNESHKSIIHSLKTVLDRLESTLRTLYSENIIPPEYRNLVAITAIYEYLLCGTCHSLEGPDGACALYEQERKQGSINDQLSDIVKHPEQIGINQMSLYELLTRSDAQIEGILQQLRNDWTATGLQEYLRRTTALLDLQP